MEMIRDFGRLSITDPLCMTLGAPIRKEPATQPEWMPAGNGFERNAAGQMRTAQHKPPSEPVKPAKVIEGLMGDGDDGADCALQPPEGWHLAKPKDAGWYMVGTQISCWIDSMVAAYFDGNEWREWVGMKRSTYRGVFDDTARATAKRYAFAWLRRCGEEEIPAIPA